MGKLSEEAIQKYSQMMDGSVERRKHGWNMEKEHADAAEFQRIVEGIETFAEKEGITGLPKHSHRFAPDNLWPDQKK